MSQTEHEKEASPEIEGADDDKEEERCATGMELAAEDEDAPEEELVDSEEK
jgi:hypothetical protein